MFTSLSATQKSTEKRDRQTAIKQVLEDHRDASFMFRQLLSIRKSAIAAADSFDEFVKRAD